MRAVSELTSIGRLVTAGEWERAAIIWAFTYDTGGGRPSKSAQKSTLLTVSEFAEMGLVGLRSRNSIIRYRTIWREAMESGLTIDVKPDSFTSSASHALAINDAQIDAKQPLASKGRETRIHRSATLAPQLGTRIIHVHQKGSDTSAAAPARDSVTTTRYLKPVASRSRQMQQFKAWATMTNSHPHCRQPSPLTAKHSPSLLALTAATTTSGSQDETRATGSAAAEHTLSATPTRQPLF